MFLLWLWADCARSFYQCLQHDYCIVSLSGNEVPRMVIGPQRLRTSTSTPPATPPIPPQASANVIPAGWFWETVPMQQLTSTPPSRREARHLVVSMVIAVKVMLVTERLSVPGEVAGSVVAVSVVSSSSWLLSIWCREYRPRKPRKWVVIDE